METPKNTMHAVKTPQAPKKNKKQQLHHPMSTPTTPNSSNPHTQSTPPVTPQVIISPEVVSGQVAPQIISPECVRAAAFGGGEGEMK